MACKSNPGQALFRLGTRGYRRAIAAVYGLMQKSCNRIQWCAIRDNARVFSLDAALDLSESRNCGQQAQSLLRTSSIGQLQVENTQ